MISQNVDSLSELLADCVVLIKSGKSTGTGFFFAPAMVLTSAHSIESSTVTISWKDGSYTGTPVLICKEDHLDIAVLHIRGEIPAHPCVFFNQKISIGDMVITKGYSDDYMAGDAASMEYEGESNVTFEGKPYKLLKLKGGQIRPGFSGSPLLNLSTGGVCGILKTSRDRNYDAGGRGIPIASILSDETGFQYFLNLNSEFHKRDNRWLNRLSEAQKEMIKSVSRTGLLAADKTTGDIIFSITKQVEAICSRYISGSNKIRVSDLLESDFTIQFKWKKSKFINPEKEDILVHLQSKVGNYLKESFTKVITLKFLVLASPGVGKSTFTYKIFKEFVQAYRSDQIDCIPVHIDLREYAGNKDFGTLEWVTGYLANFFKGSHLSWAGIDERDYARKVTPFIILDSLDEFLADSTLQEMVQKLNLFIFKVANLITCRTQFFDNYLFNSHWSTFYEKYYLSIWDDVYRDYYINWYFSRCFPEKTETIDEVIVAIDRSPYLQELCRIPIRLNMTIELLGDSNLQYSLVENLVALYDNYTIAWLNSESTRMGNTLSVEDKLSALTQLSWHFYDEGKIGSGFEKVRFTRSEMDLFFENNSLTKKYSLNTIVADLAFRSILISLHPAALNADPFSLKYTHKSFQEYLVARHLFISMKTSVNDTALAFRQFISQEIEQFLKEYIEMANRNVSQRDKILTICIASFRQNEYDPMKEPSIERCRLARDQIAYNIGHIKSSGAATFLKEVLPGETEEWVRRSIIIGLAYGGDKSYLDTYIDDMSNFEGCKSQNEVNIGTQLSYFGDQSFDVLNPGNDQSQPFCNKTLCKLIYQLGTERNRPSWRLDLYTIIFLWEYRPSSKMDFYETMGQEYSNFNQIIKKLKRDPECRSWPEILKAEKLLLELRTSYI